MIRMNLTNRKNKQSDLNFKKLLKCCFWDVPEARYSISGWLLPKVWEYNVRWH